MFEMNETYRNSQEYEEFTKVILKEQPNLNQYLVEMIILLHKTNPYMYRQAKKLERESEEFNKNKKDVSYELNCVDIKYNEEH
jgi:hypothetical protein